MTVKMSISTLGAKDRELLSILSENAREQTATIARKLGLSRTTVQAKIDRLERDGVIAGYGVKLSDAYESGMVKAHVLITIAPKTLARITSLPARILGVDAGRLGAGAPADLAIFDPQAPLRVVPEVLRSQGRNTPFAGYELAGRVRATIVGGNVVYEA